MAMWLQFLTQNGASISDAPIPEVLDFNSADAEATPLADFVAPLTGLGLIALSGEDAAHFLHNQVTNDVEHLGANDVRLAGYCSPKGRLLATLLMWKSADTIMLQLPRELQPAVQKRLQMFVLRAKVKLADAAESYVTLGLAGAVASQALSHWFPSLPAAPYVKTESDHGILFRVADAAGVARYQWITTPQVAQSAWPQLTTALQPVGSGAWRLGDIQAGIPHITQATQEQFVPQMINFELVGGVNFKKGCYPGQEIVARSQYLGKLKRRMMLASVAAPDIKPGMEIFSAADPGQPCGMIVNTERVSSGENLCLVEMKVAAVDAGPVHLGSAGGAALQFKPLPYPLTEPA